VIEPREPGKSDHLATRIQELLAQIERQQDVISRLQENLNRLEVIVAEELRAIAQGTPRADHK